MGHTVWINFVNIRDLGFRPCMRSVCVCLVTLFATSFDENVNDANTRCIVDTYCIDMKRFVVCGITVYHKNCVNGKFLFCSYVCEKIELSSTALPA